MSTNAKNSAKHLPMNAEKTKYQVVRGNNKNRPAAWPCQPIYLGT